MKLNLDYYKEDIMDKKIKNEEALSDIRKNIISWYPFKEESNILEIGSELEQIISELCNKAKKVVSVEFSKAGAETISNNLKDKDNLEIIVGNLKDINFSEKFDYIIMLGIFEYIPSIYQTDNSYVDFLKLIKELLNENGKILIVTDNKFGMRTWSAIDDDPDSLRYEFFNRNYGKNDNRIFSKNELEEIFNEAGIGNRRYFYPLPDYRYTNVIFSDSYLPNTNDLHRNITFFEDTDIINFHENNGYLKIVENNQEDFKFFANSYFIEIADNLEGNDIKLVSYWNNRKRNYRLRTVMKDGYVYKYPASSDSISHIEEMKKNLEILNKINIKTLDEYEDGYIKSKMVDMKPLELVVVEEAKKYGINKVVELVNDFNRKILDKFEECTSTNNIFNQFNIEYDENEIKDLHFIKDGLWDLNFQNAFTDGNEIYVYDQEWYLENLPKEFIIYRGIIIFYELHQIIDKDELLERLGLTKYIELFDKLEKCISDSIMSNHINSLWNKPQRNVRGILVENAKLKEENNNLKQENVNLQNKINSLINSFSWKITKPVRYVRRHFSK